MSCRKTPRRLVTPQFISPAVLFAALAAAGSATAANWEVAPRVEAGYRYSDNYHLGPPGTEVEVEGGEADALVGVQVADARERHDERFLGAALDGQRMALFDDHEAFARLVTEHLLGLAHHVLDDEERSSHGARGGEGGKSRDDGLLAALAAGDAPEAFAEEGDARPSSASQPRSRSKIK